MQSSQATVAAMSMSRVCACCATLALPLPPEPLLAASAASLVEMLCNFLRAHNIHVQLGVGKPLCRLSSCCRSLELLCHTTSCCHVQQGSSLPFSKPDRHDQDSLRYKALTVRLSPRRTSGEKVTGPTLLAVLGVVETALSTFCKLIDVDGVHCASRLVWNAALTLLGQPMSPQLKRVLTAAAQALAAVASPLHSLRYGVHCWTRYPVSMCTICILSLHHAYSSWHDVRVAL